MEKEPDQQKKISLNRPADEPTPEKAEQKPEGEQKPTESGEGGARRSLKLSGTDKPEGGEAPAGEPKGPSETGKEEAKPVPAAENKPVPAPENKPAPTPGSRAGPTSAARPATGIPGALHPTPRTPKPPAFGKPGPGAGPIGGKTPPPPPPGRPGGPKGPPPPPGARPKSAPPRPAPAPAAEEEAQTVSGGALAIDAIAAAVAIAFAVLIYMKL